MDDVPRAYTVPLVAIAIAIVVACRGEPAPRGPAIELALDGTARTIHIDRPVSLASLVSAPPASWLSLHAQTRDGRSLDVDAPATAYPGDEVRLYLDRDAPALGVFPPVTPDMPPDVAAIARQPVVALAGVTRVEVRTHGEALPPLVVEVDGAPRPVAEDRLRALPVTDGGRQGAQGWALADVIAIAAPGRAVDAVELFGAETLSLAADELHAPGRLLLLKANQRGEYVFRMWDTDARTPTRELRGVTRIRVQ